MIESRQPELRGPSRPGLSDEVVEHVAALRSEIAEARADAEARARELVSPARAGEPTPPAPRRSTKRTLLAVAAIVAVLAVVAGILAAGGNGDEVTDGAVAGYLEENVPPGTEIGVVGETAGVHDYILIAVTTPADLVQHELRWLLVGPPNNATAEADVRAWLAAEGELAAADQTLRLYDIADAPSPVDTPAPSTATTGADAPTTTPATVPPSPPPGPPPSPPTSPPTAPATPTPPAQAQPSVTVQPGDNLWLIAATELTHRTGAPPTDAEVVPYWHLVIDANADRFVEVGNPDLILPGQVLVLPET